jgi:hypothetical protein
MAITVRFEMPRWWWLAMSELYRYARVLVVLMAEMRDQSTLRTLSVNGGIVAIARGVDYRL